MFEHARPTTKSEREFSERLAARIKKNWLERGYDICVWVDPPVVLKDGLKHHRAPIFAIRSNIGPYGYPPKKAVAQ